MPASFQEILNSRLFKFIVGKNVDDNPTEFLVHEEAVAQLSKPLYNLTKGGMSESQAGCAIWADVSKGTFEMFAQFAYTGDYSIPQGRYRNRVERQKEVVRNDSSSSTLHRLRRRFDKTEADKDLVVEEEAPEPDLVAEEADPGPASNWGTSAKRSVEAEPEEEPIPITKREKYPERRSRVHSEDFHSLTFPILAPRNNYEKTCESAEHFDPYQSYTEEFLGHASLYILGDLQLIDSLKALALFKLHKILCVFQLDDWNAEDIVALARYAYSEEGGGGALDEGIGGLRSLICQYMATNAVVLAINDGFMDLLGDGGQLVKDFFKYEVQRTS
ncbi:hypothetical protein L207DRAFT_432223 [Hyaloscypha variabilis F]|uniref:BTB domain-containing protein n=1 Tax=Hyaloscypha variabilis (strain UAMH 11265 / GT02V1 / F) TaxID=1149755 RepID=A0A2J6RGU8_HYAVF|nr:hypothetical protein L207DRAFT_432223 [Hyaloscypha variabilis F]